MRVVVFGVPGMAILRRHYAESRAKWLADGEDWLDRPLCSGSGSMIAHDDTVVLG